MLGPATDADLEVTHERAISRLSIGRVKEFRAIPLRFSGGLIIGSTDPEHSLPYLKHWFSDTSLSVYQVSCAQFSALVERHYTNNPELADEVFDERMAEADRLLLGESFVDKKPQ
jgi:hypothetical protein